MHWTPHAVIVLALVLGSLAVFVGGWLRYDLVAMMVVVVLVASGSLEAHEGLAGFGSPAVILIASMFVVARAITRTGIADAGARRLVSLAGGSEPRLIWIVGIGAALSSAILNNTAVVAIFIPITVSTARRLGIAPSRVLMPLAFAALFGGMCSVIGTSTNVAINGVIEEELRERPLLGEDIALAPFSLFGFTTVGLVISAIGITYLALIGRWQLRGDPGTESLTDRYAVRRFLTEVLVSPSSEFVGKPISVLDLERRHGVTVLGIVRMEGAAVLAPTPYNYVRMGDTLILQGEPQELLRFQEQAKLTTVPDVQVGDVQLRSSDVQVVEGIVPPSSSLIGQDVASADLKANFGANVLAVWRDGETYSTGLRDMTLQDGDVLLIQAHEAQIDRLRRSQVLVVVDAATERLDISWRSWLLVGLLAVGISLAGTGILSLGIAALLMAVIVVLFQCIDADEIYDSINWRVILLTAGMIPLGVAFERHGLAQGVAQGIEALGSGGIAQIAALFAASVALTQVTTNIVAGVLLTPVAIEIANHSQGSAPAYLLAVLFGASASFLTPIGHPVNLMVMGPGEYRYVDFVRVGLPLTLLTGVVVIALLSIFYL